MIQHVKYPSIEQFRTIVKNVRDNCKFHNETVPKLKFKGTVKLHGTNAAVVSDTNDLWAQSRENIITPLQDNAGFAQFVHARAGMWTEAHNHARAILGAAPDEIVAIFGEWCGSGIQKGVGISQVDKMFVVFGVAVVPASNDASQRRWATSSERAVLFAAMGSTFAANRVFSIDQFPSYELVIDFENPELAQNAMINITMAVEAECPVAKQFGVDNGTGEGVVWSCIDADERFRTRGLLFKVKGEKHSVSKVKTLAAVDVEKVANIQAFCDKVVTENRMIQMKGKLTEIGLDKDDVKNIGVFLKMLGQDIVKEELDTIDASGLSTKDVMGKANRIGRDWFIANVGKE